MRIRTLAVAIVACFPLSLCGDVLYSHGDSDGGFGSSISMDGSLMAIGMPSGVGKVELHALQADGNWTLIKEIVPDPSHRASNFGGLLALDGDTLAVSALYDDQVFVYNRNTGGTDQWGLEKILSGDTFVELSLDGNTLACTLIWNRFAIFERNYQGRNWSRVTIFSGSSAKLQGDTVIAKTSMEPKVFARSGPGKADWRQVSGWFIPGTTSSPVQEVDQISRSGEWVAMTCVERDPITYENSAIVGIWRKSTENASRWDQVGRIPLPRRYDWDGSPLIEFPLLIVLKGTRLLVSYPEEATMQYRGSVYLYEGSTDRTRWTLTRKIHMPGPRKSNAFGYAIDTDGDFVAVGAPDHTNTRPLEGALLLTSTENRFTEWLAPYLTADPTADRGRLFQAYATGSDPASPVISPVQIVTGSGKDREIEFSLAKDAPDTRVTLEWSRELTEWKPVGDGLSLFPILVNESRDAWIYRAKIPPDHPGMYFRMQMVRDQ